MDLDSKIIAGLGRFSDIFKALIWEYAKNHKLSPIQIQILHFVSVHKSDLCNVSQLAKEFNVTKPTVSDAVRVLVEKELLLKDFSSSDSRSYTLALSQKGESVVSETLGFTDPIKEALKNISQTDQEHFFSTLSKLIYRLNQNGVVSVQRICYGCQFYSEKNHVSYCGLLNKELFPSDIRLDCDDFIKVS